MIRCMDRSNRGALVALVCVFVTAAGCGRAVESEFRIRSTKIEGLCTPDHPAVVLLFEEPGPSPDLRGVESAVFNRRSWFAPVPPGDDRSSWTNLPGTLRAFAGQSEKSFAARDGEFVTDDGRVLLLRLQQGPDLC